MAGSASARLCVSMRFEPPTEGLAQHERVVWARKQGIGFFLPFSVIWIVVLGTGGIAVSFAMGGVPLGVLVSTLVAVAMAFWTRALVVALRSKFFLTNQRVVATRGGVIFKQVPLSHFVGVPMRGGGRRLSGERPARVRGPDLRPGFGRHRRALHGSDRRGGGRLPRARQSDCVPLLWMQDLRPRFHVQQLRRSAVACGSLLRPQPLSPRMHDSSRLRQSLLPRPRHWQKEWDSHHWRNQHPKALCPSSAHHRSL